MTAENNALKIKKWSNYFPFIITVSLVLVLGAVVWGIHSSDLKDRLVDLSRDLSAAEGEISTHIEATGEYLSVMARKFETGRMSKQQFVDNASHHVLTHPEIVQISYLDASMHNLWTAPLEGNQQTIGQEIVAKNEIAAFKAAAGSQNTTASKSYVALRGGLVFAIFVPVYQAGTFTGAFSALISPELVIKKIVPQWINDKYEVSLVDSNGITVARESGLGKVDADIFATGKPLSDSDLSLHLRGYSSIKWSEILLSALGFTIIIGIAKVIYNLSKHAGMKEKIAEESLTAQKQAEIANEAKSRFLAGISHEIRTPIGVILGYSQLLVRNKSTASELFDGLQSIERNGQNLLRLVNDLLDISKVEAGQIQLEMSDIEFEKFIMEVVDNFQMQADQKKIKIKIDSLGQLPVKICSDALRLQQIIVNLLGNALKFTDSGTIKLSVSMQRTEDGKQKLEILIQDSGIGMSASQQENLFKNFGQADASISRRYGGTGLGLVLSLQLAKLLGGDLRLVRSAPGQGSTFSLSIDPHIDNDTVFRSYSFKSDERVVSIAPSERKPRLVGKHILVVDDGLDNQIIIRELLNSEGAETTLASDGSVAIDFIKRGGQYDLVLMDVQMPVIDGYEATRTIRSLGVKVPIIALTANAMRGEKERCLKSGCNDYITKPVNFENLIFTIMSLLGIANSQSVDNAKVDANVHDVRSDGVGLLISSKLSDPVVASVLGGFLARLPERIALMQDALAREDGKKLSRIAHSLGGTAGSYGYPAIASRALDIEHCALDEPDFANLKVKINVLSALCLVACESYTDPKDAQLSSHT